MSSKLKFIPQERFSYPRVPASQLRGMKDAYKIKLRSAGYRPVYEADDTQIVVIVIAAGI